MRRQRGFTLVELMVVVAIIAILGALIIGLSGRTYGVNATTFSEQVSQTFQYARSRAQQTRRIHRVSIYFDLPQPEIWVFQSEKTGMNRAYLDLTDPATFKFVERTIVPKSVTMFHAIDGAKAAGAHTPTQSTTRYDIDFLPNGTADAVTTGSTAADATTIYVTEPGSARSNRVIVYAITGSSYVRKSW